MKAVLILGAGVMQLPSIRIARTLGWRTVVADANPAAVGAALADRFEQVDLRDRDGMLALARRIASGDGLAGVFTAGTDFSTTVSFVAEALGLPCVPLAAARSATDKVLMRQRLRAAGVPGPRFASWDGKGDPGASARGVPFPAVVKPVDSMGARAVRRVDDGPELAAACREAVAASRSGRAIVEECMDGPELSLDAVVHRGRITICGVADRIIRFPPRFVEMGHTMPTALPESDRRRVEAVFEAGIRALGIDNGAAKGDIKLTPRGPMVGEIAARLSGGYMSGWTWPLASGREVTEAALRIACGAEPGSCEPNRSWTAAERAFISLPGVVRGIEGLAEAWAVAGVQEVFVLAHEGAAVVFPANNVQKCGNVIAAHPDSAAAVLAAERAAAAILVRLEPLQRESDSFLFGPPAGCPHPCFDWTETPDREALERMPLVAGDPFSWQASDPLPVLPLPALEAERSLDWHGRNASAAMRAASRMAGILALEPGRAPDPAPSAARPGFALGSVFWRAFGRGSVQAAVYLSDSLREAARRGSVAAWVEATRLAGQQGASG